MSASPMTRQCRPLRHPSASPLTERAVSTIRRSTSATRFEFGGRVVLGDVRYVQRFPRTVDSESDTRGAGYHHCARHLI